MLESYLKENASRLGSEIVTGGLTLDEIIRVIATDSLEHWQTVSAKKLEQTERG
tara:strand:- start:583 stop:744 length:162 start_codon:yes stop_codon:yes gene_type:complete